MMQIAYIGLGSNLAIPHQQVLQAIQQIKALAHTTWLAESSLYLTPPWGIKEQPAFINAVVKIATDLPAHDLLDALLAIEVSQQRVRAQRYGPRTIDCDILLYADEMITTERLQVPHPFLLERAFVVIPLFEIAPALILPTGQILAEVVKKYQDENIKKFILPSEEIE
ncbi:2-amino-4-hydroxy-6-hydroxymethyldihydropteridine diphosphokinase [Candidatus Berkiella aquae]|uniref:2-amino-4-hydroxy-6-hydroxymethyldihydropteridine pyrophosphokinase n=1 Tax=Candidatus Berkiella aquae TaxID=295108 RepID=A0A0Q9YIS1_9GAMM|nr:2-amino-4-hydroxy-6-hydroxymethyldihydropteridine diphosphokinase [Candidatus Berkiella aquae]MCS5710212.1 2-amino-4-hydroxy-6-hydroxymethyldihydropteridine diphosphokinase [Candidatus Berkiella aquae]